VQNLPPYNNKGGKFWSRWWCMCVCAWVPIKKRVHGCPSNALDSSISLVMVQQIILKVVCEDEAEAHGEGGGRNEFFEAC